MKIENEREEIKSISITDLQREFVGNYIKVFDQMVLSSEQGTFPNTTRVIGRVVSVHEVVSENARDSYPLFRLDKYKILYDHKLKRIDGDLLLPVGWTTASSGRIEKTTEEEFNNFELR